MITPAYLIFLSMMHGDMRNAPRALPLTIHPRARHCGFTVVPLVMEPVLEGALIVGRPSNYAADRANTHKEDKT